MVPLSLFSLCEKSVVFNPPQFLRRMQRALLEEEGVAVSDTNIVDLQQYGWNPTEDELQWLSDCFIAMGI